MNKLTKLLSIFVIAGAIGTGVAGVAGCKKQHQHEYESGYTSYEESGHAHKAKCHPNEHDELKPHVDEKDANGNPGKDGICDECKYLMDASAVTPTVSGVTVSGASTGTVGTPVTLTATVTGSANVSQSVTWQITEGGDIATITSGGVLTATAAGTVKVTATSAVDTTKTSEAFTVTFSAAAVDPDVTVESVTVSGASTGTTGVGVKLTATVTGSAGVAQTVTWTITQGSDIATISADGTLTATAAGTVKVKAISTVDPNKSSEEFTVTFTAAVVDEDAKPEGVSLDTTGSTSNVGRTFDIVATISNAAVLKDENKALTWDVEDDTVARIETTSADKTTVTIRVIGIGETKITVTTVNNKTAEYTLTAVNPATGISAIKANGEEVDRIHLTANDATMEITAVVTTGNEVATSDTVVWSVSNSAVLSVTPDENDSTKATVRVLQMTDSPEQRTITATITNESGTFTKTIFCTAETYYGPLVNDTEHLIFNENFSSYATNDKLAVWSGTWGTKGVYSSTGSGASAETNYVSITTNEANNNNNRAELVDPGSGETVLTVDLGKNKEGTALDGVIKGYANVKFINGGTGWTPIRFYGKNAEKPNGGEVFGFRIDSKGILYRLNGSSTYLSDGVINPVAFTGDMTVRLRYEIDLEAGTISITINGNPYLTNLNIGITEFYGIQFYSSNSGSKTMSIDNIAATNEGITVAALAEKKLAALEAIYATYAAKQPAEGDQAYTAENWNTLKGAYDTAHAALEAAKTDAAATKVGIIDTYDEVVAVMAEVETIADAELNAAKAAIKLMVDTEYPATNYTINSEEYKAAYDKLMAAIDAYKGEVGDKDAGTGLYGDEAINNTIMGLVDGVDTDQEVLEDAQATAITELEGFEGGKASFSAHETEYDEALANAKNVINNVTLDQFLADNTAVDTALGSAKQLIEALNNDGEQLALDKSAAIKEISDYIDTKKEAIPEGTDEAKVTAFNKNVEEILSTRTAGINAIVIATGTEYETYALAKAAIDSSVSNAKTSIDTAYTAATASLAETKESAIAAVRKTAGDLTTGESDQVLVRAINDELEAIILQINGVTVNEELDEAAAADKVTDIQKNASRNFEFVQHKISEIRRMKNYADGVIGSGVISVYNEDGTITTEDLGIGAVGNKAAIESIDKLVLQNRFRQLDGEGAITSADRSQEMANIYNASSAEGVTATVKDAIEKINAVAKKLKDAKYTVTINVDGIDNLENVAYGTVLSAGDIDVSKLPDDKTIAGGKWYADVNCTDEYHFGAVYDDLQLYAKVVNATKVDRSEAFKWADIPSDGKIKDTVLTAADISGSNAFLTLGAGEVRYRLADEKEGGKNFVQATGEAFKVTFNAAGTLEISARGTGSSAHAAFALVDENGNRCELDGALPKDVTAYNNNVYDICSSNHVTIKFNVKQAGTYSIVILRNGTGDPVEKDGVQSTETFGMARISAIELKETYKLEHDITVKFGDGEEKTYHHSEKVTAPAAPEGTEGQKFDGWYDGETKFEDVTFEAGGNYNFTAKFLDPNVVITYIVGTEQPKEAKFYLEDGVEITLRTPAGSDGKVFSHWSLTEDGAEYNLSSIEAGTSESPNTVTLYAVFKEGVAVESVTISGETKVNVGSTITLTATVNPDNADNAEVTWAITEGGEFATIDAATGVVTGVAQGTVKVVATAGGVPSEAYEITVEKQVSEAESFIIQRQENASETFATVSADTKLESNDLFDITANVDCTYKSVSGKGSKVTLNDNSQINISDGSLMTTIEKSASVKVVTIKANENIQLRAYFGLSNDSWGSSVSGTVTYVITHSDGSKTTSTENYALDGRATADVNVQLAAGDVIELTINSADSKNKRYGYFGGAEAKLVQNA